MPGSSQEIIFDNLISIEAIMIIISLLQILNSEVWKDLQPEIKQPDFYASFVFFMKISRVELSIASYIE